MTRPPAPALTAKEARVVARFEAAPVPEEVVVETVARAIFDAANSIVKDFPDYWERVTGGEDLRDQYRRLAAAAIAALPPSPAEEAVKRVEAQVEWLARADWIAGVSPQLATSVAVRRLRSALASPAPAPQDEDDEDDGVDWAEVAWDDLELRGEAACCDPRDHSNGWDDDVQCPCREHPRSYLHPSGDREWSAP